MYKNEQNGYDINHDCRMILYYVNNNNYYQKQLNRRTGVYSGKG